ncbi:hypothetical protein K1T71_002868 [Dendrolimus kikuchii]|uniref:Uncharacterized protein n=1 Tax=Dendrolimus kikuchii TaxID=765133 RepID=A0ACC1DEV5_9NEOP|nr:hypothetical protein K1T71_002868 [Dendrolimus kikuchii]
MYIRRSATVKYFLVAYIGAALYCEWLVYIIQPIFWPDLQCNEHDSSCTKILFIADPQIQGDTAVPPPMSYLFNWDSDRYLKSSFSVALNHFKPEILVYLGDLTDEGSIATMKEFNGYVKRLSNIFNVNYEILQVWVPGDNDIGGENEPIKADKVAAFENIFDQPFVIMYRNISFYKVNAITHTIPQYLDTSQSKNYKMVVSHYPITEKRGFVQKVNSALHPNIYFCAHDHDSKYVKQNKDLSKREKTQWLTAANTVLNVPNDESLYEIYVPTCSYRMGTSKIGYGAALLEHENSNLRYTVFWSPTRFPYLFLYLLLLIIALLYCIVFCAARLLHRQAAVVSKGDDKVPLLERI